jgi:hypothetical protein
VNKARFVKMPFRPAYSLCLDLAMIRLQTDHGEASKCFYQ